MIVLKGITWDHERGYSPLVYTSRAFSKLHPDIRIDWKKRTLKEYGDYPVEKLAQTYDLLLVDHPFMGEAAKQNILLDLEQYMDAEALAIQAQQELGASYRCYRYGDKQLALSVDTAMVTAAYRSDLLSQFNMAPPKTFAEMCSFAKALPKGKKIASPLCPTDIWCTFLSLGAALAGADFITEERIHHEAASEALEKINTLRQLVDPRSLNWNPIQVQDNMTADDKIVLRVAGPAASTSLLCFASMAGSQNLRCSGRRRYRRFRSKLPHTGSVGVCEICDRSHGSKR